MLGLMRLNAAGVVCSGLLDPCRMGGAEPRRRPSPGASRALASSESLCFTNSFRRGVEQSGSSSGS